MISVDDIKQKVIDYAKEYLFYDTHSGRNLRKDLKLTKIKNVWIRKVINSSITIYVISYDSKFPTSFLPRARLKQPLSSYLKYVKMSGGRLSYKDFVMTPAIDLNEFNRMINGALVIVQDLAAEHFINKNIFECTLNGLKQKYLQRFDETL